MNKKQIMNMVARIKKAQTGSGCMGEMMLHLEIDAMSELDRKTLQVVMALLKTPMTYGYLNSVIALTEKKAA